VLMAGMVMETWVFSHYAAPITGLVCALVVQAMRHLRLWHWRGRSVGRLAVWTIWVIAIISFLGAFAERMRVEPSNWGVERERILTQLKNDGKRHLVVLRTYSKKWAYQEWVYNEADIDGARVVWAREMDTAQNRKLLAHFKNREVWLVEVDQDYSRPRLMPYPIQSRP